MKSPQLFGLGGRSNRDATQKTHWGKNEFNSSFPAALLCYMHEMKKDPIYLKLNDNLKIDHFNIDVKTLFGINPLDKDIYFSFEDTFAPYQSLVRGQVPRSDLVILDCSSKVNRYLGNFEIKLTALPDNSTCHLGENQYGCEMVFRQPAIIHLALSISCLFENRRNKLLNILSPVCSKIFNWRKIEEIVEHSADFIRVLDNALLLIKNDQIPFIIQPIWKTKGKRSILEEQCLDVFVWSNLAFTRLFMDFIKVDNKNKKMTRHVRCLAWLVRMLYDYAQVGQINPDLVPSEMAYELQTDKAFSISGLKSWKYMKSKELNNPRINKKEIKNIILNGGQELLSPERRFDAALINTPGLFD